MKQVSSQEQQAANEDVTPAGLSPETASRILAVLAENPSAPERIDVGSTA